jgi:hypothetical protein
MNTICDDKLGLIKYINRDRYGNSEILGPERQKLLTGI